RCRARREWSRDRAESAACRSRTCCRPPRMPGSARYRAHGCAGLPPARPASVRRDPRTSERRSCRECLARYAEVLLEGAAALQGDDNHAGARLADDPTVLERLDPQGGPQSAAEVRPTLAPVAARRRELPALAVHLIELDAEASKHALGGRP